MCQEPGGRKGFGRKDCRVLIIRAHTQLGGPAALKANAVSQLPAYAPDRKPQDGIWSLVERR